MSIKLYGKNNNVGGSAYRYFPCYDTIAFVRAFRAKVLSTIMRSLVVRQYRQAATRTRSSAG